MHHVLAGHCNTFHSCTLDEALRGIAEAGYRHVELSAMTGWSEHVDLDAPIGDLRARLADHGLIATVLSAHSDLTTADGVAHGVKAVRWCAAFGIPVMTTTLGDHARHDERESATLAGIRTLAAEAGSAGVDVALEIHGDLMATGARSVPLLERIGHPRIKVAYDTGNCEYYGATPAAGDIGAVAPYLANVHLKDKRGGHGEWDFPAVGDGHVDFRAVLAALDAAGYAGPLSVEIEFRGEPWPPLADVTEDLRRSRAYLKGMGIQ